MNEAKLTFDALIENEPFARCVAAAFVAKINPTMDELIEVKTIVSEAVANAIIHGYENQKQGKVQLIMQLEDNELTMIIQDDGCGIENIAKAREPLFTTKAHLERSGMGMTIMESLSDDFQVESSPGTGTKLTIVKKFKGHGGHESDN